MKALVLWGMARAMQIPRPERPVFIILLAQGGEFGFVVFQGAWKAGVIDAPTSSLLVAAVAVSMLLTPLLLVLADRYWIPLLADAPATSLTEIDEPQNAPVIIAGFGRYGQIVGRLLFANGYRATVLDHDAEQVAVVRRFGWPVFYGDATRLDLLRTAGAASARVLVSRSTTWRKASRLRSSRASTSRNWRSSRVLATCGTTTSCATSASS